MKFIFSLKLKKNCKTKSFVKTEKRPLSAAAIKELEKKECLTLGRKMARF